MLTRKAPRTVALTLAAILALGSTACSGDGSGDEAEAAGSDASGVPVDGPELDSDKAADDKGDEGAADSDSAYDSDLEILGVGLQASTAAARFTVDGDTLRLHFTEGSVEDPSAHITCSAASQLLDSAHRAVVVFPDGEMDCSTVEDAAGAGGAEAAGGSGAGSATLTIGDHSWEFESVVCGFGEEEIGAEGAEFALQASSGSAMVYAAVDADHTYIEFNDSSPADPALAEFITAIEPTIEIDGTSIYAPASFRTYEDETLHHGALSATCP